MPQSPDARRAPATTDARSDLTATDDLIKDQSTGRRFTAVDKSGVAIFEDELAEIRGWAA